MNTYIAALFLEKSAKKSGDAIRLKNYYTGLPTKPRYSSASRRQTAGFGHGRPAEVLPNKREGREKNKKSVLFLFGLQFNFALAAHGQTSTRL